MRPIFKVLADADDITAKIADRLSSLSVTDEAGVQSDTVDIRLDNRGLVVKTPSKGVNLKVWLGFEATGLVYQGAYVVDETEVGGQPDTLSIKGKSADMTSEIKARKTRSWDDTTLGAIVAAIAGEHGLTPAISPDLARSRPNRRRSRGPDRRERPALFDSVGGGSRRGGQTRERTPGLRAAR